jgi:hypothetical protein
MTSNKRGRGRPTKYSKQLADEICRLISEGKSIATICKRDDMPSRDTVHAWIKDKPDFSYNYAQAKDEGAEAFVDQIIDIADEMPRMIENKNGELVVDSAWVTWQNNRVHARKWIAVKLLPRKYGDKMDVTSQGEKLQIAPIVGNGYQGYISGSEQLTETSERSDSRRSNEIQSVSMAQTSKEDNDSDQ